MEEGSSGLYDCCSLPLMFLLLLCSANKPLPPGPLPACSRYLANKCSIASRIDCFMDSATDAFGQKLREQVCAFGFCVTRLEGGCICTFVYITRLGSVMPNESCKPTLSLLHQCESMFQVEERLRFYEEGVAPRKNLDVMHEVLGSLKAAGGEGGEGAAAEGEKKKKKKKVGWGWEGGYSAVERVRVACFHPPPKRDGNFYVAFCCPQGTQDSLPACSSDLGVSAKGSCLPW